MLESKRIVLTPFLLNAVSPQPLFQFKKNFYKEFQVVFLLNMKPDFKNVAPEQLLIQNNTFCVNS